MKYSDSKSVKVIWDNLYVPVSNYLDKGQDARDKGQYDNYGLDFLSRQRVATFGNSKTSDPQDWIEINLANQPDLKVLDNLKSGRGQGECGDVVTSLHIEIYHTSVGSQGKGHFLSWNFVSLIFPPLYGTLLSWFSKFTLRKYSMVLNKHEDQINVLVGIF